MNYKSRLRGFLVLLSAILVFWVMGASVACAQKQVVMQNLSIENGLAGTPLAILQDYKGFMWFGTDNGLQRYDGQDFINFHYQRGNKNSIAGDEVGALYEDKSHHIWIAGGNKVSVYNPQNKLFRQVPVRIAGSAGAIRDQWDFVTCNNSLFLKSRATNLYYKYTATANAFLLDKEAPCTNHPIELSENEPVIFFTDRQKNEWKAGTQLYVKPAADAAFSKVIPIANDVVYGRIFSIYQDREETIWLGTDKGIFYFNLKNQIVHYVNQKNISTCLLAYKDQVWTGNFNGDIQIFDNRLVLQQTIHPPLLFNKKAPAVLSLVNRNDEIYASRSDGEIWSINAGTFKAKRQFAGYNLPALHFAALSKKGEIWWTSKEGALYVADGNTLRRVNLKPYGKINRVVFDTDGDAWVSTSLSGLLQMDAEGKRIKNIFSAPAKTGFVSNDIGELRWQNDSVLVMATAGGIQFFNIKSHSSRVVSRNEGLMSNAIINIVFLAPQILYYTTQYQVGAINIADGTVAHLGVGQGIGKQSYAFPGSLRLADGKVLFNTLQGLYYIEPRIYKATRPPAPELISIQVMDKAANADGRSLNLKHDQDFLRFGFASLSFIEKENVAYEYKLTGNDPEWIKAGHSRFASYSNLKSGQYVFNVRAVSNKGFASAITSIKINIQTPFWATWWFITACIIAVLLPFYIIIVQNIRRKRSIIKVKETIARDLHDDMGSTLSTISILADVLQQQPKPEIALLNKISTLSRQTLNDMDDLVWSMKQTTNTVESFCARIKATCEELTEGTPLILKFTQNISDNHTRNVAIDLKYDILMIVKEAVNNAIRHSGASDICVGISVEQQKFSVEIKDNGKGFDTGPASNGNGLMNMRARCSKHRGNLQLTSAAGSGTVIKVDIKPA